MSGPKRRTVAVTLPHVARRSSPRGGGRPLEQLPILAFDPGGTTGWSLLVLPMAIDDKPVFSFSPPVILAHAVKWEHGELEAGGAENEVAYQMSKMVAAVPHAAVVVEDFILRAQRKEKSRELLSPVRITAKLESYMWHEGRKPFLQQAGDAKHVVPDECLARWGALVNDGLPDHARDADRHAVLFMRSCIGLQGAMRRSIAWPYAFAFTQEEVGNANVRD